MKVRRFLFGLAAALAIGATANAGPIVIPTNQNGADTEIRESEINATALAPTIVPTQQRGASTELATRGINTTITASGDRSSVMYLKFDISGLPNHTSDPGFWADRKLYFKATVRNTNLTDGRIVDQSRNGAPLTQDQWERVKFTLHGLEPGHVYADDDPNAANRVDRSGRAYTSPHYEYNWDEGTGTGGSPTADQLASGITYLDAPGITPFCTLRGACDTATFGGLNTDIFQSVGVYDDFNSDTRTLGTWTWPLPKNESHGSSRYPIGMPLEYTDTNGNLKQLVLDAQDAGRSNVTLMLNLGVSPLEPEANGGIFSTADFLSFNYLFNPKEKTTLDNDNSFDPDGSGPLGGIGSPYSCTGTNCDGVEPPTGDLIPGRTLGNNTTGAFSPSLIVRVPEPTSLMLLALGSLAIAAGRRRT